MKEPSMATFLIAFLLAAAVFAHGKEVVKDTNGNPVKPGAKYFIQAVETESNMGGGLIPNAIKYPTCPFGIIQTRFPYQPGTPVNFEYPFIDRDSFETSSDIHIRFRPEMWVFCTEFSKLWAVDVSSSAAKEPVIIIGGELRRPDSVFKVEKATRAHTYKLTTSYGTVGTVPAAFFDV
ncbi:hypothetical protein F2Q70_00045314 [Brassica cretica]|uniref:Uncharacterized protein n=1 Tax=Brassica cretica TaxID=69181 RepID=A0A8S9KH64_BRACR|nr:hypothetical protein F2Q70_00045314 [Brassica cretica]